MTLTSRVGGGRIIELVPARRCTLKPWLRPSNVLAQDTAHRFLGDGPAQQALDRQMDVCRAHGIGLLKRLNDSPLHDPVAEPASLWLRLRTLDRLQRLARQSLEHGLQGCGGVCTVS